MYYFVAKYQIVNQASLSAILNKANVSSPPIYSSKVLVQLQVFYHQANRGVHQDQSQRCLLRQDDGTR